MVGTCHQPGHIAWLHGTNKHCPRSVLRHRRLHVCIARAEGEFELSTNEIRLLKEKFPNLPEMKKIKLYRTNKNPNVQYEFENCE